MKQWVLSFYKIFDIEPTNNPYWFDIFGTYPPITDTVVIQLEEMLIDMNKDCHIELYKEYLSGVDKRVYHYVIIQNDYNNPDENYSHMFCNEPAYNRKEALIRFLTHYAHVPYIYENVRKILKV